jgi:hypothetical protein
MWSIKEEGDNFNAADSCSIELSVGCRSPRSNSKMQVRSSRYSKANCS